MPSLFKNYVHERNQSQSGGKYSQLRLMAAVSMKSVFPQSSNQSPDSDYEIFGPFWIHMEIPSCVQHQP